MILFHTSESTIFGKKQNDIVSTNAVSPICHSDSVRRAADWQQNKSPRKSEILAKEGRFPNTTKYNFWSSLMPKLREKYLLRWMYILFKIVIFEFLKHSYHWFNVGISVKITLSVQTNRQQGKEEKYWMLILGSRGRPFYGFPLPLFCGDYHNMWQWRWQLFWRWL